MANTSIYHDRKYREESLALVYEWVEVMSAAFERSPYIIQLNPIQQASCSLLLRAFFESCYCYGLVTPGRLNEQVIKEIMLKTLPKKTRKEHLKWEAFAPVMVQFLKFCEANYLMEDTQSMQSTIYQLSPKMLEAFSEEASSHIPCN